jgi:UDP-N-acetyl-2-amino-2-deoxyglucuronate dehydrogenase
VTVGLALIGTGVWARTTALAVGRTPSVRLVTCYSRDEERRAAFAAEHGCDAAATLEVALEHPDVHAALIVTPNDTHLGQALAAAERGLHVLVEKPIADTVERGEQMRDAFADAGLVLGVGHALRRLGAARRIKEVVDGGELGTVVLAEANFSLTGGLSPAAWRWYRERNRGGVLLQLGVHFADTLAYWLGPIVESSGVFARVVTDAEIDDAGVLALRFESGAVGSLTGSYVSPRTYTARLLGTEAVLEYDTDFRVWPRAHEVDAATTLTLHASDGTRELEFEPRDPLAEQLDEFARAVRGEARFETGPDEAVAALRVIEAALPAEAART